MQLLLAQTSQRLLLAVPWICTRCSYRRSKKWRPGFTGRLWYLLS